MAKSCNLRYEHLRQLESEFSASSDAALRRDLAARIVELRAELGGRNEACEDWLKRGSDD